jgi:LacI family transcriptional regulator
MAVTLKTIAEKAGVDTSVVSRVINNKAVQYRISSKRAEQILRISEELGYIPNAHAKSISSGKFNCVALLSSVHREKSYLPSRLTDAISHNLEEHGRHLMLAKIPDKSTSELESVPLIFRTLSSDGMIVNYTHSMPDELVCTINNLGLCVVWFNTKRPFDAVYSDSLAAATDATEMLVKMGHKKIAYVDIYNPIAATDVHFSVFDRYQGYNDVMDRAGLEAVRFSPDKTILPGVEAEKFFYNLLINPNRPSAIITYWSHCMGALYKAANSLNINIPNDLSVITFASESSVELGLGASAMIEPEYETGTAAVELYIEKELSSQKVPSRILKYKFCDMGSCRTRHK